jgi:hypothetical protein
MRPLPTALRPLSVVVSLAVLLAARPVPAEGLDRDTLLTDAPATPDKGTVRVMGASSAQGPASDGGTATGKVSGSVSWTPLAHFSADVGAYYQGGPTSASGPSARVRYQVLSQSQSGLDLSAGVRFKTVSFSHPSSNGEVELLLAGGRRFGKFDLAVNGVFGMETGGGTGKDVEVKAFAGYRFSEVVRAGLDSRLQAEVGDEKAPAGPKVGRDFDVTAGPAVAWLVTKSIELQALVGAAAPKGSTRTLPVGLVAASLDF